MEDAEGVSTESGVGMVVLDRGGFLRFAALSLLLPGWLVGGVKVPRWGWQVPERNWGVEGVVAASLVRRGGSQDGGCVLSSVAALFICSTGFR